MGDPRKVCCTGEWSKLCCPAVQHSQEVAQEETLVQNGLSQQVSSVPVNAAIFACNSMKCHPHWELSM
jgi:hypothetical protein